jgi:hypothetical protein
MSDPFKEFVEEMARLTVPEDDTEESRGRRERGTAQRQAAPLRRDDLFAVLTSMGKGIKDLRVSGRLTTSHLYRLRRTSLATKGWSRLEV